MQIINPSNQNVIPAAIILGGGRGTRLYPLTHDRCKPAVPLAGKYRLIDIALSNCINSHLHNIYVVTQFNSASLNQHIAQTYRFDQFSAGFVNILAASQTSTNDKWHQGTADAVRSNLEHLLARPYTHFIILPGDSLCRMDYRKMLRQHIQTGADLTVCCRPVDRSSAPSLGIVTINEEKRIIAFNEKPSPDRLDELKSAVLHDDNEQWIGSMGMYIFNRDILLKLLHDNPNATDLSKDIIPPAVNDYKFMTYIFHGFWRDIGTIKSLFESNLLLLDQSTSNKFRFYHNTSPIYTRLRNLPGPEIVGKTTLEDVLISEGSRVISSKISRSILGLRSIINANCDIEETIFLGNDYYTPPGLETNTTQFPPIGIGHDTVIKRAIVDKNARVGNHCKLVNKNNIRELQTPYLWIRNGIIVIPKNAILSDGTEI